jgi:hypothetical protein
VIGDAVKIMRIARGEKTDAAAPKRGRDITALADISN